MSRLAVVLLLLLALPARANLGDAVADCVKRYGAPGPYTEANAKTPFGTMLFAAGPYQLLVFLSGTTEVGARVSKKDKSAFTDAEMKTIMDADATTPWVTIASTDPTIQQWTRGDKSTAMYDKSAKMLIFTSPQMVETMRSPPPLTTEAEPPKRPVTIAAPVKTQWDVMSTNAATNAAAPVTPAAK